MSRRAPSSCAIASAQIVLPVPGGPAKLKASARLVGWRSFESPSVEDEVVLRDVHERLLERSPRRRRENHVVEAALRDDGFDDAGIGGTGKRAKEGVRHRISVHGRVQPSLYGRGSRAPRSGSLFTAFCTSDKISNTHAANDRRARPRSSTTEPIQHSAMCVWPSSIYGVRGSHCVSTEVATHTSGLVRARCDRCRSAIACIAALRAPPCPESHCRSRSRTFCATCRPIRVKSVVLNADAVTFELRDGHAARDDGAARLHRAEPDIPVRPDRAGRAVQRHARRERSRRHDSRRSCSAWSCSASPAWCCFA